MTATLEHYVGSVCNDAGLIEHEKNMDGDVRNDEIYKKIVRAKTFGCTIIKQANAEQYKVLLKDTRVEYLYG